MGEACDLVNVKPHVLRYWETQFPRLNPSKNRAGNRVYQRKDIELIMLVKRLLYTDRYTIEGARRRLKEIRGGGSADAGEERVRAVDRETAALMRKELSEALDLLTPPDRHS